MSLTTLPQQKSVPYQIDYKSEFTGKYLDFTKKTYRWEFGFADDNALVSGKRGADCRGEEHEVVLTWSLISGKMMLMLDNKEMHYDTSDGELVHIIELDYNGIVQEIEVEAHLGYVNDILELRINGQPFKNLLKIYELSRESTEDAIEKYSLRNTRTMMANINPGYYDQYTQDENQQEIMSLFTKELGRSY